MRWDAGYAREEAREAEEAEGWWLIWEEKEGIALDRSWTVEEVERPFSCWDEGRPFGTR